MIFGKKKEKLDESLSRLYPKYAHELEERKEKKRHHKEVLHNILHAALIALMIIAFVGSFILIIISSNVGTHETKYTLPSGEVITTNPDAKVYLNGQKLEGIETNDNKVLFWVSLGGFFGSAAVGIYYIIRSAY